ncbi:MAG: cytochrome c [Candidatus Sulfotelmatobacter sp.]|jgi:mono/diheme cytochrome c family protein
MLRHHQTLTHLLSVVCPTSKDGCPILARFWRKSGIPRKFQAWHFLALTLLLPVITLLSSCRIDMHVQPRENPLSRSDFFSDQRSERPPVEGTIARGELRADTYFYTGKTGNTPGDYMPFPVTKEVLERGRERYNIYCAPCHSRVGDGNGFIPSRGFPRKPPSYHIPRLQKAPLGYFYDVITSGFGIMPDYASQIPPRDRWNIVAYVRALQLSQNATRADVPSGQDLPSEPPQFSGEPGSGATLPVIAPEASSKSEEQK